MSRSITAVRSDGASLSSAARSSATRSRCSSTACGLSIVRRLRERDDVDVVGDHVVLPADAAVVIDAEVAADADQPRREVRAAIERVERLEQLEEDVLREIFGLDRGGRRTCTRC